MKKFLEIQESRYECLECGDVVSVHDRKCYACEHIASKCFESVMLHRRALAIGF